MSHDSCGKSLKKNKILQSELSVCWSIRNWWHSHLEDWTKTWYWWYLRQVTKVFFRYVKKHVLNIFNQIVLIQFQSPAMQNLFWRGWWWRRNDNQGSLANSFVFERATLRRWTDWIVYAQESFPIKDYYLQAVSYWRLRYKPNVSFEMTIQVW